MNNKAYHFKIGLLVVVISIFVFAAAFFTEDKGAAGFVVSEDSSISLPKPELIVLNNADSLAGLSPGNYYIDSRANVQWIDDSSKPIVAKLLSYNENEVGRHVYVSIEGEVFFIR